LASSSAFDADPTVLLTVAGLAGIAVSITGNETARRWGRARVVTVAMSAAAVLSLLTGWSATAPAVLAAALVVLWNAAIYFDSSALTAGTVQAADKELRGATMGLHSMCGYAGGFVGPLGVGLVLDWAGNAHGWGLAFGHLALITLSRACLSCAAAVHEVPTVAASSASRGHRGQMFRGRKTVAAAPAKQASPQVPKLTAQAASCEVPPNWSSVTPNSSVPRKLAPNPMQE
jgi:MFS family permease